MSILLPRQAVLPVSLLDPEITARWARGSIVLTIEAHDHIMHRCITGIALPSSWVALLCTALRVACCCRATASGGKMHVMPAAHTGMPLCIMHPSNMTPPQYGCPALLDETRTYIPPFERLFVAGIHLFMPCRRHRQQLCHQHYNIPGIYTATAVRLTLTRTSTFFFFFFSMVRDKCTLRDIVRVDWLTYTWSSRAHDSQERYSGYSEIRAPQVKSILELRAV